MPSYYQCGIDQTGAGFHGGKNSESGREFLRDRLDNPDITETERDFVLEDLASLEGDISDTLNEIRGDRPQVGQVIGEAIFQETEHLLSTTDLSIDQVFDRIVKDFALDIDADTAAMLSRDPYALSGYISSLDALEN